MEAPAGSERERPLDGMKPFTTGPLCMADARILGGSSE